MGVVRSSNLDQPGSSNPRASNAAEAAGEVHRLEQLSFNDRDAIRFGCTAAPLSHEEQLFHLQKIHETQRQLMFEVGRAPLALRGALKLLERYPEVMGRRELEAAWADTVAQWERRGAPNWSERYAERRQLNQVLVAGVLERVSAAATQTFDVAFRIEKLVRDTHRELTELSMQPEGPRRMGAERALELRTHLPRHELESDRARLALIEAAGADSLEKMIRTNTRLVGAIAVEYHRRIQGKVELDDLFQRGTLGLMSALKRFDPAVGARLSTYASMWIKQSMGRGLVEVSTVRVPQQELALLGRFNESERQLAQQFGRLPHQEEVAAAAGLSLQRVLRAKIVVSPLSGGDRQGSSEEYTVDLPDRRAPRSNLGDALARHDLDQILARVFDGDNNLRTILQERYMRTGSPPATLRELSETLRLTRERVRQMEFEAFDVLADYLIVQGAAEHRREEVGARALLHYEWVLLRNVVAERYVPLRELDLVTLQDERPQAIHQQRMITKTATALRLHAMGAARTEALLDNVLREEGRGMPDQHREILFERLFGPPRPWGEPARGDLKIPAVERKFRSAIELLAPAVRQMWRAEQAG